jgi:hypothetical protein
MQLGILVFTGQDSELERSPGKKHNSAYGCIAEVDDVSGDEYSSDKAVKKRRLS